MINRFTIEHTTSRRHSGQLFAAITTRLFQLLSFAALALCLFGGKAYADIFVSDLGGEAVMYFDDTGALLSNNFLHGGGSGGGEGVACVKAMNNELYVANNSGVIGVYDVITGAWKRDLPDLGGKIAALSFSKDGSVLYVANYGLQELFAINPATGANVYAPVASAWSHDVVVGPDGFIYAAYFSSHNGVVRYDKALSLPPVQFIPDNPGGLHQPAGMAFDQSHNLWVSNFTSANSAAIYEYSLTGTFLRSIPDIDVNNKGGGPFGLDVGPDGNIYATNLFFDTVSKIDVSGGTYNLTTFISDAGSEPKYIRFTENCCDIGYVEICKDQCGMNKKLTGNFIFNVVDGDFNSGPITVPVDACSGVIRVPSGTVTVNEAPTLGVGVTGIDAVGFNRISQDPENRLVSSNKPHRTADVTVVPGDQENQTIVDFTNCYWGTGALKICKVAGPGVDIGTPFTFTATNLLSNNLAQRTLKNGMQYTVPAGPPPEGYCVFAGAYPVGSPIQVQESVPPGYTVSDIAVVPPDRAGTQTDNSVVVAIDHGTTEATFTNAKSLVGSCNPSSSLSVLLVNGKNVIAYVPKGSWGGGSTGVAVANIEGNSITNVTLPTTDVINSCASEPTLTPPLTVCSANSNQVYVFDNTPKQVYGTLTSAGSGTIGFSGGSCTNCGVAIDAVHHQAVLGLSLLGGQPGFQFIDLFNFPTPPIFEPGIVSPAGAISENPLIDPINKPPLLLSAAENGQYEIADITNSLAPVFYENYIMPPLGTEPDSSGEDCSTGIAMAPLEFTDPSVLYLADLNQSTFGGGTWSAVSQLQTLSESSLSGVASGIAVAQGTHYGVVSEEFVGDSLTAIRLPSTSGPGAGVPAVQDWVTCNIGNGWSNGYDPHTVTAYTTPGNGGFPKGDALAVLANGNASQLAVVDINRMLDPSYVPRTAAGHGCASGPLKSPDVVTFITLTP